MQRYARTCGGWGMAPSWDAVLLGDVVTLQRGFDLPSQDRLPGTVPIVSSSGVTGTHADARVKAPGVVTGRYGTIGEVFYVAEDFWPLNTTLYVKDFWGNDPLFVSYLLRTIDYRAHSDKSSVPGVNRNHLHTIPVKRPPLSEQRAIAHILGTLDDKIELNRRMNATLEEMARTLFRSWFVDFDPVHAKAEGRQPAGMDAAMAALFPDRFEATESGNVPTGWGITTLNKLVEVISGGTPKTSVEKYWNGKIPWFSVVDAPDPGEVFVLDTERHITQVGLTSCASPLLAVGTSIISARGTVGKVALVAEPMAVNQSCYGIRDIGGRGNYYIHFLLRQCVAQLQQNSHGSVFETIIRSTLETLAVAAPPLSVCQAYESPVRSIMSRLLVNLHENRCLSEMRDTLLPRLLSGEIRVHEAERQLEAVL
jgi:type I restriction enzyme S subunit